MDSLEQLLLLDDLIEDFYNYFIYYVPEEIIDQRVLDETDSDINTIFYDSLSFLDVEKGIKEVENKDAQEATLLLGNKRSRFEEHLSDLIELGKCISEAEFMIFLDKYQEQLLLYYFVSRWLAQNTNKLEKGRYQYRTLSLLGTQFGIFQHQLNRFYEYFKGMLDTKKEYNFSDTNFVIHYVQDFTSRINSSFTLSKILENKKNALSTENSYEEIAISKNVEEDKSKSKPAKKKKKQFEFDKEEAEKQILRSVFKVDI